MHRHKKSSITTSSPQGVSGLLPKPERRSITPFIPASPPYSKGRDLSNFSQADGYHPLRTSQPLGTLSLTAPLPGTPAKQEKKLHSKKTLVSLLLLVCVILILIFLYKHP